MNRQTLRTMVFTGVFMALVLLLGLTPLGLIPLGFINVTILCVPVIVGTLVLGLKPGLVLGFCFGAVSAWAAFDHPSALVAPLVAGSPLLTLVMCFLPRLLVPISAYAVHRMAAARKGRIAALPLAAALGSLTNTVLYLGLMLLFYTLLGLDSAGVLGLIGGIGLIAGGSEAAVAAILVAPITTALRRLPGGKT